jgi:hypothetical protein
LQLFVNRRPSAIICGLIELEKGLNALSGIRRSRRASETAATGSADGMHYKLAAWGSTGGASGTPAVSLVLVAFEQNGQNVRNRRGFLSFVLVSQTGGCCKLLAGLVLTDVQKVANVFFGDRKSH